MNPARLVGYVLLFFALAVQSSVAQVTTATILGVVSDASGAVIPGASVTIRNVETGVSRSASTDEAGRYRAPQLGPGSYEVVAEAPGFQSVVRTGIELSVGREAVLDFAMQVGAVAERITVTGEAPLLETTNATVSNLVDERTMQDLPLNGRSFTDLAVIQPGVVSDIGIGGALGNAQFTGGKRLVINGARPQQSLYLLDGTDIVAPYENVTPSSVLGEFLGVDTTREFSLIQTNAGAQYGRAMGGIINAITRSGTNELHGSAFEFIRNEKFDANNFFLNKSGVAKPVLKRNQFGGTVGGPIIKDSTFFFAAYEGLRHVQGRAVNTRILTREARNGWLTHCATGVSSCSSPVAQVAADTITVHPDIKPLVDITPLSNLKEPLYEANGNTRWVGSQVDKGGENYGMFRIDQKISDSDSLYGRFTIDNSDLTTPVLVNLPSGLDRVYTGGYRFAAVEYTRIISPTVLNSLRLGFNRNNVLAVDDFVASEIPRQAFIVPDPSGPSGYARNGLPVFGGATGLSLGVLNGGQDNRFVDNTYIISDTVNWSKGSHSLAIGGNFTRYQMNANVHPWGWGNITFANERSFLTGVVREVVSPLQVDDHYRGWRQTYGALFFQDDWNARPGLTLNLGLRWERVTAPMEVNGKMAGLPDIQRDSKYTTYTDSLFNLRDSLKGFAPRFGFAWTPFGEKTVFRGAFGAFKEIMLEYQYQLAIYQPPWSEKFNITAPPWPDPIKRRANARAGEPNVMSRDMKYPYNVQWNFGIERQLSESMTLKATYIGTRSISLVGTVNANPNIPVKTFDPTVGYERWETRSNATKPNPAFASTRSWHNIGDAWYNSLQAQLQQRYNSGVNYNVSYTFSKNMDTIGTGNKCAETSGGSFYIYNLFDIAQDKSLSLLHSKHNFSISSGYELPFGQGKKFGSGWNGVLNLIAGGWEVNGIFTARSGQPFRIANNFDRANNGTGFIQDRPDLRAGYSNNPVEGTSAGCTLGSGTSALTIAPGTQLGTVERYFDPCAFTLQPAGRYGNMSRLAVISPGITTVNLSVFKGFRVGENKDLQFRAEFFNMPNHPNFSSPGSTIFTSATGVSTGAGEITSMRTTPRQIQMALKFTF